MTRAQQPPWPVAMRCAAVWIVFLSWSACTGWILSSISCLNRAGYAVALFPLVLACLGVWRATAGIGPQVQGRPRLDTIRKHFPWLLIITIGLVGGLLHAPTNYDALSYRLPRILYWWQENHWYWFVNADDRMNYSGTGFEWQMLPVILFSGGDRLLFLLNWLPYLLMPALCFHGLISLGANKSAAAVWMWIIPVGYGFALQSSSIGNDSIGGILAMASLAFSAIAARKRSMLALVISALAMSSLSGLKLSNLPIILPLAIIWLFAAIRFRPVRSDLRWLPVVVPLVLSSFLPLAVLCQIHCGNWAGDPEDEFQLRITNTIPGIVGNTFNTLIGALQPPFLPLSKPMSKTILAPLDKEGAFTDYVQTGFPRFHASLGQEIPTEEGAGMGLAITLLLAASMIARRWISARRSWGENLAILGTAIACAAYLAKMGSECTARLTLPYAPVVIAALLALASGRLKLPSALKVGYRWVPMLFVLPGMLLNPNRPLVPYGILMELPGIPAQLRSRIAGLHDGYSTRNDPLQPLRNQLPKSCNEVGFAGSPTQSSYSLFKPLSARRVVETGAENINAFEWLVATPIGIQERTGMPWNQWLPGSPYGIVASYNIAFSVKTGREEWYLLKARERQGHPVPARE